MEYRYANELETELILNSDDVPPFLGEHADYAYIDPKGDLMVPAHLPTYSVCSAYRGPDPVSGCEEYTEPNQDYCAKHLQRQAGEDDDS